MVDDVLRILAVFERAYEQQEELLKQLDRAVRRRRLVDVEILTVEPAFKRPPRIFDYVQQNRYEERMISRVTPLLERTLMPRAELTEELLHTPVQHVVDGGFDGRFGEAVSAIAGHIAITPNELTVNEAVQQLQALQVLCGGLMEQLFYELIIVEEAMSRVQQTGVELGDLVSY